MGTLGLIGKNSKEFYELLKTTMKLENEQISYLIRKITSCCSYKMYVLYILYKGQLVG